MDVNEEIQADEDENSDIIDAISEIKYDDSDQSIVELDNSSLSQKEDIEKSQIEKSVVPDDDVICDIHEDNLDQSVVELDNSRAQIEQNIEETQVGKTLIPDDSQQQKENDSLVLKCTDDRSSTLKEKFTENLQTIESIKDTDISQILEINEELDDETVESTSFNKVSSEKKLSQDQGFSDTDIVKEYNNEDEKVCLNINENKDLPKLSDISVNTSDVIPTNIGKLNENSELLSESEESVLEESKSCDKKDLQVKETYLNEPEIKIQITFESETSQNKIYIKENTMKKENFPADENNSIFKKFNVEEEENKLDTPVLSNKEIINNDNMIVDSENLKMPNKTMVENETLNSDENSSTNHINVNNNQPAERDLLTGSNNEEDLLSNSRSLAAIQKPDEDNFNNKVQDSFQESKNLDIPRNQDSSLQGQDSDSESEIVNNVNLLNENSSNLSEKVTKLSAEKEIKISEHLENYSDYSEVRKETSEDYSKKNTTSLHECSDKVIEVIVLDDEPKDKEIFDKSAYFTEAAAAAAAAAVQPVMSEETKKDSKVLDKGSDDLWKETMKDKGTPRHSNVLEKHTDDFTKKTSEDVVNVETKRKTKDLDECSDKLIEEMEEIVMENEPKDKQLFDESSTFTEEVQPAKSEKVEKNLNILGECSDVLCIEAKETIMDKETKTDPIGLEKHSHDYTNKTSEDVESKKDKNEVKFLDECSENIKNVEKTLGVGEQMKNFSKILSNYSGNFDNLAEDSKDVENDAKKLDECSSDFAEVEEKNVREEEVVSESHSNYEEERKKTNSDSDTDSNPYINISEYLINLNKKDNISTCNQHEENKDKSNEKTTDEKSSEADLKSVEENKLLVEDDVENESVQNSPQEYDNNEEVKQIDNEIITTECDSSKSPIEDANDFLILELSKEDESHFEIDDKSNEENTKKKQRKPITTEGLARSSKSIFTEVPGKEIEDGPFTRAVIVGDSFISNFTKMWPENSKIKPYFLYKNNITFKQIIRFKIQDHDYLNGSEKIFVLFICGLHELSFYATYKFHGCRGTHHPFKYVRKVENDSHVIHHYFKEMTILKERLENNNGVFVAFSYLPVIDMGNISNELSEWCRNKNFGCSCNFSLGTAATVESINSICNINRNIFYRNLNETKVNGIFEFSPVNITFYCDRWCLYSRKLKLKENSDILGLSYLIDQYVYKESDIKPNINMNDSGMSLPPALHATTSDTYRILIIGDAWIKYVAENWDVKLDAKPYFYCKNGLTLNCIQKVIRSIVRPGMKLLIICAIPSGEFLTMSKFSECKNHNPLEYPIPHLLLLKDPSAYSEYVIKKLDLLSLNVQANKLSKMVFLTCYPAFFKYYYKSIYEKHSKNNSSHESSKSLEDMHDCSEYETKLEHCFKKVNIHAAALNKELGIKTCNIFSLIHKLSSPVFPIETKSVSENLQKKLLQLFETYACSLYTENIFSTNFKTKIDEKNSNKETVSDVIWKSADICVKIENKSADNISTKSSSAEPSGSGRTVVIKDKKKKHSILNEKLPHISKEKFRKGASKKLLMEIKDKREISDRKKSPIPKASYSNFHGPESSSSYYRSEEYPSYYGHGHGHDYRPATSNRYDSKPKPLRDFSLRGRKRSRSNSRNRNYDKRSKGRIQIKRRISRSRSPYRRHHESEKYTSSKRSRNYRSKSRSKSQTRPSGKQELSSELASVEKNAVANLWEAHSRECEMYRRNPANHPDHDRIKRKYLDIMKSQGLNVFDPSVLQCWWEYWLKKMEEILEASWQDKKKKCLAVLTAKRKASKSPVSRASSSSCSDHEPRKEKSSKKRKKSKSKKSKTKKKSKTNSSPISKEDKFKFQIDDNTFTTMEEIEKKLQDFVKENHKNYEAKLPSSFEKTPKIVTAKPSTSKEGQEMLDVLSILCQISDKFGALGMSLTVLHEKAIECVRKGLNPYNCIDEDIKMLLDLISDKITKILENSNLNFVQRTIVQEAHDRLVPFLESVEKSKESNVNIESLAKATMGLQASDIIGFIRADLASKSRKYLSNQDLMDLYLQVKTYQMKIITEKKQNILLSDISKPSSSKASSFFS